MPMGLSISPCKWIEYISYVMEHITHKQNFIAIMDDLLIHSKKKDHMARVTDILKALIKHGLKLSPKKCQFLGGLSLHLNHLIAYRLGNFDWTFGTLPFGIFGSNLDTMDLETYARTYSGHF